MISEIAHWISTTLSAWYQQAWLWTSHLDKQQWLILLAATTIVGFFCMRGFWSRTKY